MKKMIMSVLMMMITAFGVAGLVATPAWAEGECPDGWVRTSIFGEDKGNGVRCMDPGSSGEGIFKLLNVVLTVMTYGVGILATIGIVLSGYTYLTAKDDASKVVKAKERLIQIVIGLAIYAVIWSLLQFLLPGGLFGNGS